MPWLYQGHGAGMGGARVVVWVGANDAEGGEFVELNVDESGGGYSGGSGRLQ